MNAPYPTLIDIANLFLMDTTGNKSITVLKGHSFPTTGTCNKICRDISSQYLWIPFDERIWYLSNASLSLDWRKNTSTGHRSIYLSRISRVLNETSVLIKARIARGVWNASFG